MTDYLYHGPSGSPIADILAEGVRGPSYWGTLSKALEYASDTDQVFRIAIERFDPDLLAFNDLLAACIADSGEDVLQDGSWEDSLREHDSVRYDGVMQVDAMDLFDALALQASPAP